jgi:hypothetical protein
MCGPEMQAILILWLKVQHRIEVTYVISFIFQCLDVDKWPHLISRDQKNLVFHMSGKVVCLWGPILFSFSLGRMHIKRSCYDICNSFIPGWIPPNWLARQLSSSFRSTYMFLEAVQLAKEFIPLGRRALCFSERLQECLVPCNSIKHILKASSSTSCLRNYSLHSFLPSLNSYYTLNLNQTI